MPIAPFLGVAAALCLLLVMYWRAPRKVAQRGSWSSAPEPAVPGRDPAWREARGLFKASGVAKHAGDLAIFEVRLERPLRRPPLGSLIDPRRPAPGTVHLRIAEAENCVETSLRALITGQPRCTAEALIFAVNAEAAGPYAIHGNFEVRA